MYRGFGLGLLVGAYVISHLAHMINDLANSQGWRQHGDGMNRNRCNYIC